MDGRYCSGMLDKQKWSRNQYKVTEHWLDEPDYVGSAMAAVVEAFGDDREEYWKLKRRSGSRLKGDPFPA